MRLMLFALLAVSLLASCARSGSPDKFIAEAKQLQESGDVAGAVEVMGKATQALPKSARAWAYLGLYTGMRAGSTSDFREAGALVRAAFEHLDRAVALDSLDPDARFFRGILGTQVPDFFGKLDQGVRDLEFVTTRSGADTARLASAWSMLGAGYQKQDRLAEARGAWQQAADIAADTALAAQARARVAVLDSQGVTAAPAIEPLPDNPAELRALGERLLAGSDFDRAVAALRKAVQLDSSSIEGLKLLSRALAHLARRGYDEQVNLNTDVRTRLAFEYYHVLDRAARLAPKDLALRLERDGAGVHMPFFVGALDPALSDLESIAASGVDDTTRAEALYLLGVGYHRKATSYWAKTASKYEKTPAAREVLAAGRPSFARLDPEQHRRPFVAVSYVLGFQDELEPQTAVWVEDATGAYVATVYVSGFSGHARAAQPNLLQWAKSSSYRGCDAVTQASVDVGEHVCVWDLKDYEGRKVPAGTYVFRVECSWWPSMRYGDVSVRLALGSSEAFAVADTGRFIPMVEARCYPER